LYIKYTLNWLESTTGHHLSIKTNKIIAGLEPTKTNELLQLIGIALQQQVSIIIKNFTILKNYNEHCGIFLIFYF
jgi:hypothetical protein